ncbi:MAG: methanol dehydrogenase [Thermoleophilia bacterium]|nr:methanol dehydrogenase [Thermoleophilia bacterium]
MVLGPSTRLRVSDFHLSWSTRVEAGVGAANRVGAWTASYGRRALVVVGDRHARASGLLPQVLAHLGEAGVATELFEGVPQNPSVAVVEAGAHLARAWRADVIVGVGGGSVLDVAKAIAVRAAEDPDETRSYRRHLSGLRDSSDLIMSALPIVAVPTLPGSGSETSGTSVITDDETGRKLSCTTDLAEPRLAIIDPLLAVDAPPELLGVGLVDAFCHALEAALSQRATIASDALAEQALRLLQRHAPQLTVAKATREQRLESLLAAWWGTELAGQALTLAGSIVTHPLAHPLSARLDASHGAAVAALEPAVLVVLHERWRDTGAMSRVAHWLDVRGFSDHDVALRGVLAKLQRFAQKLGVTHGAAALGVTAARVDAIVRDARASGSRGLSSVPGGEPSADELLAILDLARTVQPMDDVRDLLHAHRLATAHS